MTETGRRHRPSTPHMRGADKNRAVHGFDFTPLPPHARGRRRRTGSPISPTGLYPRIRGADFAGPAPICS